MDRAAPSPLPSPPAGAREILVTPSTLALPSTQAAAGGGQAPALRTEPASAFSPGPFAAGLLLACLAAAAMVMARRRGRRPRLVEIVESASLGPRRSLIVARLGGELLVLGSSEGGVSLLATRSAAGLVREPLPEPHRELADPPYAPAPEGRGAPWIMASWPGLAALLSRLRSRLRLRRPSAPTFDGMLTESLEDVELRRKLAAGRAGITGAAGPTGSACAPRSVA